MIYHMQEVYYGRFSKDIENIDEGDMKDYVRALQEIMKIKDPDVLKEIFDECGYVQMDKASTERKLKNEYWKKFKEEGVYIPQEKDLAEDETKVYEVSGDFRMMIHSVGAFYGNYRKSNYKTDWNRPEIGSRTFLCKLYKRGYDRNSSNR